jgi:ribosomal 50S subunit-recycling heat shock protein
MLNLIGDREYQLLLDMEDEQIRLGGKLVLLFFNTYIIDKILQEKRQTLSEPVELYGKLDYSDGRSVEEGESGKDITIDAIVRISKLSVDKKNKELKIGDIVKVPQGSTYQEFTILNIRPVVKDKEYLDRVMSYDCELKFMSSRKLKNER